MPLTRPAAVLLPSLVAALISAPLAAQRPDPTTPDSVRALAPINVSATRDAQPWLLVPLAVTRSWTGAGVAVSGTDATPVESSVCMQGAGEAGEGKRLGRATGGTIFASGLTSQWC